jgi:GT2 family glycosyltransferase
MGICAAVVVNWNGARYLPRCLEALAASTLPVRVVVVDNASTDGSVELIRAEHPDVELIPLSANAGYAGGANAGIRGTTEEFVMIMNPDVILAPDHLAHLTDRMRSDASIGAAQGKLYQIRPDDYVAARTAAATTLDSAGHAARRSRMVVDIGQSEPDGPRFDEERSVFSACGAALLLRREMLDDVAIAGEVFDEDFFAYKEDIDLCWRARILGWDVRYVPAAVAFHVRGWAGARPPSPRELPRVARRHSWKNHYLLILKNDSARDALISLPFILGWELVRQGYAVLRDPMVYGAYADLLRLIPGALRKRRSISRRRRADRREIRRWFGLREGIRPTSARPPVASEPLHLERP